MNKFQLSIVFLIIGFVIGCSISNCNKSLTEIRYVDKIETDTITEEKVVVVKDTINFTDTIRVPTIVYVPKTSPVTIDNAITVSDTSEIPSSSTALYLYKFPFNGGFYRGEFTGLTDGQVYDGRLDISVDSTLVIKTITNTITRTKINNNLLSVGVGANNLNGDFNPSIRGSYQRRLNNPTDILDIYVGIGGEYYFLRNYGIFVQATLAF